MQKSLFNSNNLFNNLLNEVISSSEIPVDIIEFAEELIFNGKEKLYPTQKALLKAFYNLPLLESEKKLLLKWFAEDRTTWIEGRFYKNLVVECGRRGSKSTVISLIVLYEFYKLLLLKNPAKHYGLLPNSPISILIISRSFDQVKRTLFAQIKGYAENSDYFKSLENKKIITIQAEGIFCYEKNISIFPAHTQSRSLVGFAIKLLVLDEASRFERDKFGKSKGDDIWSNIGAGTKTFGKEGFKIAISSAWEEKDYIEELYDLAKKEPTTLGFKLRTWDLNISPNVSEAEIKSSEDYIKNPIKGALEYEGIRYKKQGSFFNIDNLKTAVQSISKIDAYPEPFDYTTIAGTKYLVKLNISRIESLSFDEFPSFIHCDYGVKKDAAAIAIARASNKDKLEITIDAYLVWQPYLDRDSKGEVINRIVSLEDVENKIIQICSTRPIGLVSFDSFQSQQTIQKLHSLGILTKEMSTTINSQLDYFNLLNILIDRGQLILPRDSKWSTLAEQELSNLIRLPNNKIDHPRHSSKDLADAIANATYNCYHYLIRNGFKNQASSSNLKVIKSSKIIDNFNKVSKLPTGAIKILNKYLA